MNLSPIFSVFLAVFIFTWTCSNFFGPAQNEANQLSQGQGSDTVITTVSDEDASEGLDLRALPGLIKEVKTPEELEQKLNEAGGVNNLDLNNDGVVDYINVTELKEESKNIHGFKLSTEVAPGEVQDLATIEVEQKGESVEVNTYGNNSLYGGAGYTSSFPLGSFFLMSYFLSPHSLFFSPWSYGSYPNNYRPYNNVSRNDYLNRASRFQSASNPTSRAKNFTATQNANSGIKKNLRNPTASQRAFRTRELNRSVGSGGFGRNTSKPRSSAFGSSSSRIRGFSSSRRGFGGFGK